MMLMENWATRAVEKLDQEKSKVSGQKETAMSAAVMATLKDFCLQDEEFAQAIVQGGSFADCMKAVAKGVGITRSTTMVDHMWYASCARCGIVQLKRDMRPLYTAPTRYQSPRILCHLCEACFFRLLDEWEIPEK